MNNGSGLRVVLWLSGCNHHCKGCQNPQTWDINSGIPFDEKVKEELFRELDKDYISGLTLSGGDPLNEANLDDVLDIVTEFNKRYKKPHKTTLNTNKNHTLTVVNTNKNHENTEINPNKIRLLSPSKTIWVYTGYNYQKIMRELPSLKTKDNYNMYKRQKILKLVDVLVDGRYIESQRDLSLKWRGSTNQRVIDIKESIKQNKTVLYCD